MVAHAAVSVDDDLAPRDARVAHRAADDEAAGGVDHPLHIRRAQLGGNDLVDDLFVDGVAQLVGCDAVVVLGGDDHRADLVRPAVLVLDRHLALAVGAQPRQPAPARVGEAPGQLVRERDGQRHQLRRLVAGVAEHHPLVARALLLAGAGVDAHGDLGRLLLHRHHHSAALRVEAQRAVVEADARDGAAGDGRVVEPGVGGDLAEEDDEAGLDRGLEGDAAALVLAQALVEHRVGDLIADFVGVAFGDRFRGEERVAKLHGCCPQPGLSRPAWNVKGRAGCSPGPALSIGIAATGAL